jgi:aconitate hydratase
MGILPLQFRSGETAESLGLTGREVYHIDGVADVIRGGSPRGSEVAVRVEGGENGATSRSFRALVRLDTPQEVRYYEHGGILPYVLRRLLKGEAA